MRTCLRTLPVLALVALAACGDTAAPSSGLQFSLFLTDAPGDVRAWASFSEIYVQGENGRVPLLSGPTELIEITALVGTVQELVDGAPLPIGTSGQIRAVVDQAVLEDGEGGVYSFGGGTHPESEAVPGELKCPSCGQSGIKIRLTDGNDGVALEDGVATVLLDFDVAQSFGKPRGGRGGDRWVMHPVIMGTVTQGDAPPDAQIPTGMIQGLVQMPFFVTIPQCPAGTSRDRSSFVPTATMVGVTDSDGNPMVRSGTTTSTGAFEIPFLPAGEYQMGYETVDFGTHELVFTAAPTPLSVTLAEDQVVTDGRYMITAASCQATGS